MAQIQHSTPEELKLSASQFGLLETLLSFTPERMETIVKAIQAAKRHLKSGMQWVVSEDEKEVLKAAEGIRMCATTEKALEVMEDTERLVTLAQRVLARKGGFERG